MLRREFLKHSGLVLAVAILGVPSFGFGSEAEPENSDARSNAYRLYGHKRLGCAHGPDEAMALRFSETQF